MSRGGTWPPRPGPHHHTLLDIDHSQGGIVIPDATTIAVHASAVNWSRRWDRTALGAAFEAPKTMMQTIRNWNPDLCLGDVALFRLPRGIGAGEARRVSDGITMILG